MSIKIEEVSQPQEFVYPLAFRSKTNGQVVIFTGEKKGVVVISKLGSYPVGEYLESWVPHIDANTWEPITITISHP